MSVALAVEEVTFTDGSGAPLVIGRGTDKAEALDRVQLPPVGRRL
jgi:hypothetical protein